MLNLKANLLLILLQLTVACKIYAQTGPGGVGSNDGTSALKLWLDAGKSTYMDTLQNNFSIDGSKVMLWSDLSGSNNHVSAVKDSSSPTLITSNPLMNNQSALRFYKNGTSHKRTFLASDTFSNTNDITIYCVFHALSKGGGNNVTPFKSTFYNPNMWYYGYGLVDAGNSGLTNDISLAFCDTSIAAGAGDFNFATDYCVKTPASIRKTYFATLQKEAWTGNLSIAQNAQAPAKFKAGTQPINKASKYVIGSTSDVNSITDSPFFDGYMANVLVYNRLLTLAEQVILQNYLSAKYNITLKNNDVYTFDDSTAGNFDFELVGIGKAADGTYMANAKGDGLIELSNPHQFDLNSYIFVGNNGKSLNAISENNPLIIASRFERNWIYAKTGNSQKVDFIIDPSLVGTIAKDDFMLLVDTDNNGDFSNETFGKGVIPISEVTAQGRYAFRGLNLNHGNRFTFAKLKPTCLNNCEVYFTPNGDGVEDFFYLEVAGKTSIYDRSGTLIKNINTPSYWDGTNEKGEISLPGIYFLVSNNDLHQTITIIR